MSSDPSQITGIYVSEKKYESYSCDELNREMDSLSRRENALVVAQEQRRRSSKVQAFGIGYGSGDGIEASELAAVRGEMEAVRKVAAAKCARS